MSKLVLFGSSRYGQCGTLPEGHNDYTQPHVLLFREEIQSVACGYDHTLILTKEGNIYAFGNNRKGQLGNGSYGEKPEYSPRLVKYFKKRNIKIVDIAGGKYHSVAVSEEGNVYAWGHGGRGELGDGKSSMTHRTFCQLKPTLMLTHEHKAKGVSCGEFHTAIVTKEGKLLMCGDNAHGQLGLNKEKGESAIPIEVELEEKVIQVSCGQNHTAVLTESGKLYVSGKNDHNQLGLINKGDYDCFKEVENGYCLVNMDDRFGLSLKKLDSLRFVSSGWTHTVIAGKHAKIFTAGSNMYGERAGEPRASVCDSKDNFNSLNHDLPPVKYVSCGAHCTIILLKNGEIKVSGSNNTGQLGLKGISECKELTTLVLDKDLDLENMVPTMVSCGTSHTAILFKPE